MPDQYPIFDRPTKEFTAVNCKGMDEYNNRIVSIKKPENILWGDAAQDAELIKKAPLIPELLAACIDARAVIGLPLHPDDALTIQKKLTDVIAKAKQL